MCVNYLYVIGNVQFFRFFWGVRWPRRLIANSDCFTQTNGSLNLFFRFQNQRTFSYKTQLSDQRVLIDPVH
jgi:hypothetical protein